MDHIYLDMFKFCIVIWLSLYGSWFILGQIVFSIYQTLLLIIAIFIGLIFLKLQPPDKKYVEEIIGRDPSEDDDGSLFIRTIAHRGAGLDAPENTLAAFKNCKSKGCTCIELDLSITTDGVPIIFHDDDLLRLTGKNLSLKDLRWDELSKIDLSQKHPLKERFPNTKIAKFDDAIEYIMDSDIRVIIDLKDTNESALNVIHNTFKKQPKLYQRALVSGFNPLALYKIRRNNPKIACSMAYRPFFFSHGSYSALTGPTERRSKNFLGHRCMLVLDSLWEYLHPWVAEMIGLSVILLHKDVISMEKVRFWRSRNIRVMAWTVNQPAEKLYCAKCLKITYLTDTFIGETTAHNSNNDQLIANLVHNNSLSSNKSLIMNESMSNQLHSTFMSNHISSSVNESNEDSKTK